MVGVPDEPPDPAFDPESFDFPQAASARLAAITSPTAAVVLRLTTPPVVFAAGAVAPGRHTCTLADAHQSSAGLEDHRRRGDATRRHQLVELDRVLDDLPVAD